jgi:hypothetical protein
MAAAVAAWEPAAVAQTLTPVPALMQERLDALEQLVRE